MKGTILGLLSMLFFVNAHAQGCSDAGFCSLGSQVGRNYRPDLQADSRILFWSLGYKIQELGRTC